MGQSIGHGAPAAPIEPECPNRCVSGVAFDPYNGKKRCFVCGAEWDVPALPHRA